MTPVHPAVSNHLLRMRRPLHPTHLLPRHPQTWPHSGTCAQALIFAPTNDAITTNVLLSDPGLLDSPTQDQVDNLLRPIVQQLGGLPHVPAAG